MQKGALLSSGVPCNIDIPPTYVRGHGFPPVLGGVPVQREATTMALGRSHVNLPRRMSLC